MMWSGLLGLGALVVGLPLLIVSAAIIPPWFGLVLAAVLLIVWLHYRARRRARAPRDAHLMAEFNQLGRQYKHWLEPIDTPVSTHVPMSKDEIRALQDKQRNNLTPGRRRAPRLDPPREQYPPRLPRAETNDLTSFDDPYDDEDPDYEG